MFGNDKVMQFWQERYGQYMEEDTQDVDENNSDGDNCSDEPAYNSVSAGVTEDTHTLAPEDGAYSPEKSLNSQEVEKENTEDYSPQTWQGKENAGSDKSSSWGAPDASSVPSAWGPIQDQQKTVEGWGEALTTPLPPSSNSSEDITPGDTEWGEGKSSHGDGWGDVSTWGESGGGDHQSEWDRLWIEVTNEVYQAELVKWMLEREEHGKIENQMSKCKLTDVDNADNILNLSKGPVTHNHDIEKCSEQKLSSGLGLMLKQLKENVPEVDEKEQCVTTENDQCDDQIQSAHMHNVSSEGESDEVPGIAKVQKAFDQLGYVFEMELGERATNTPTIRYVSF